MADDAVEPNKPEKPKISRTNADWERIEREYRAGQLSVNEIGRTCGISHTAIHKRAKRDGWTRNLTARIRQEVSARLVSAEVFAANTRDAIDVAATRSVAVILGHRRDISTCRNIHSTLVSELRVASGNLDEIETGISEETRGDKNTMRRASMMRAVTLPSRARTMLDLAGALKTLVTLERQAFNIDDRLGGDPQKDEPHSGDDAATSPEEAYRRMIAEEA